MIVQYNGHPDDISAPRFCRAKLNEDGGSFWPGFVVPFPIPGRGAGGRVGGRGGTRPDCSKGTHYDQPTTKLPGIVVTPYTIVYC